MQREDPSQNALVWVNRHEYHIFFFYGKVYFEGSYRLIKTATLAKKNIVLAINK